MEEQNTGKGAGREAIIDRVKLSIKEKSTRRIRNQMRNKGRRKKNIAGK